MAFMPPGPWAFAHTNNINLPAHPYTSTTNHTSSNHASIHLSSSPSSSNSSITTTTSSTHPHLHRLIPSFLRPQHHHEPHRGRTLTRRSPPNNSTSPNPSDCPAYKPPACELRTCADQRAAAAAAQQRATSAPASRSPITAASAAPVQPQQAEAIDGDGVLYEDEVDDGKHDVKRALHRKHGRRLSKRFDGVERWY